MNEADMEQGPGQSAATNVFGRPDAYLQEQLRVEIEARRMAEARPIREPVEMLQRRLEARVGGTIFYAMTPNSFHLDIPVEALANLSEDSHTRMLAMISEWIARHKPVKVETSK